MSRRLALLPSYARKRISVQANGCWLWIGSLARYGYGVANLPGGKRKPAHRYVYELLVGDIPTGKFLDHQCHNQDPDCVVWDECTHHGCVNPDHLEPATPRENSLRGKTVGAANASKATCPEGHPYDWVDRRGWRTCSTCALARREQERRDAGVPPRELFRSHCVHGHEFTPQTTRWSQGKRYCKTCDHLRIKAAAAKRRKPCAGCGGPKEPGASRRYCTKCRPGNAEGPSDTPASPEFLELVPTRKFWTADELALLSREDLSIQEIAALADRSVDAIRSKRNRAQGVSG